LSFGTIEHIYTIEHPNQVALVEETGDGEFDYFISKAWWSGKISSASPESRSSYVDPLALLNTSKSYRLEEDHA
jgi:hypothetical protein